MGLKNPNTSGEDIIGLFITSTPSITSCVSNPQIFFLKRKYDIKYLHIETIKPNNHTAIKISCIVIGFDRLTIFEACGKTLYCTAFGTSCGASCSGAVSVLVSGTVASNSVTFIVWFTGTLGSDISPIFIGRINTSIAIKLM